MADACGVAGGTTFAHSGPGDAVFHNTSVAKMGDLGSKVLRKAASGTVWQAGAAVEVCAGRLELSSPQRSARRLLICVRPAVALRSRGASATTTAAGISTGAPSASSSLDTSDPRAAAFPRSLPPQPSPAAFPCPQGPSSPVASRASAPPATRPSALGASHRSRLGAGCARRASRSPRSASRRRRSPSTALSKRSSGPTARASRPRARGSTRARGRSARRGR